MQFLDKFKKDAPETQRTTHKDYESPRRTGRPAPLEDTLNLEEYLPQPVEDGTIIKELFILRSHIEAHGTTYYHSDNVAVDGAQLQLHIEDAMLKNTTENTAVLTCVLLEPKTRAAGIRIVIARILFASIDFFGDPQRTLLPPAAAALMAELTLPEDSNDSLEDFQLALARWRILTTFLLRAQDNKSRFEASDRQVQGIIDAMDSVLAPFIDKQGTGSRGKEARDSNLALITRRAARLGAMLFSQPTTWRFSWDLPAAQPNETSKWRGAVVYPAIWKTGDPDGRQLPKAVLKDQPQVDSSPASNSTELRRRYQQFEQAQSRPNEHDFEPNSPILTNRQDASETRRTPHSLPTADYRTSPENFSPLQESLQRPETDFRYYKSTPISPAEQTREVYTGLTTGPPRSLAQQQYETRAAGLTDQHLQESSRRSETNFDSKIPDPNSALSHQETLEDERRLTTDASRSSAQACYETQPPQHTNPKLHERQSAVIPNSKPEPYTQCTNIEHNTIYGAQTADRPTEPDTYQRSDSPKGKQKRRISTVGATIPQERILKEDLGREAEPPMTVSKAEHGMPGQRSRERQSYEDDVAQESQETVRYARANTQPKGAMFKHGGFGKHSRIGAKDQQRSPQSSSRKSGWRSLIP